MRKTFLKATLMATVLVAGLSLTSCKEKTETTTEETTIEADGDTMTTTETEVDETGAKDTIAVTTDTVVKVKQ